MTIFHQKRLAMSFVGILGALVPSLLASAADPIADFQARCAAPGVMRCVGFDSPADVAGTHGDNSGIIAGSTTPTLDTAVKASGGSSLKFTVPVGSAGAAAGLYFSNFSSDLLTQFGENSEFYYQWRQRFSPEFINPGAGFKQSIVGQGDLPGCTRSNSLTTSSGGFCASSCTQLEVVSQNTSNRRFAQMYHSCGAKDGHYEPLEEPFSSPLGSSDFKLQNARPAPYCLYLQGGQGYFPPTGNCIAYVPNEWMTFQVHVKIGTWYQNDGNYHRNSAVEMWIAREGQPAQLAHSWTTYDLANEDPRFKYGKVWFLPYSGTDPFPQGGLTWYDELIISRSRIPDPASPSSDLLAPSPPAALNLM